MKSSRNYPAMQLKAGIVLAAALAIMFLALIFPTKGINPFADRVTLIAYFPEVSGLRASALVRLSGLEVGTVSYVDFGRNHPLQVKVLMRVQRRVLEFLRSDSRAAIKGMGLLGDMYVELTPGTEAGAPVASGAVLAGVPPARTQEDFDRMIAAAEKLVRNLEHMTAEVTNGQGTLGRLIQDPTLYAELSDAVRGIRQTVDTLNSPEGTAGRILKDPALYQELLATVKDLHQVVSDIREAETKLITPQTREALEETVKTVSRVVKRVGETEEKLSQVHIDLNFGLDRYFQDAAGGHADLLIWPSRQRYYVVGVQQVSRVYGHEKDRTTFQVQLAWRILDSPLFIRGGLMKSEYFVAGLDVRPADDFKMLLDAYRVEFDPVQVDVRAGYTLFNRVEFSAGAEDLFGTPFYKAGIIIHYPDEDLLNAVLKFKFF